MEMGKHSIFLQKRAAALNAVKRCMPAMAGLALLLCVAYRDVLFGKWKLSYTNFSYDNIPFANIGVDTQGPWLSDPADNILPIAYYVFHERNLTDWLPTWGIGGSAGINLYFSPLNYLYLLPLGVAIGLISLIKVIVAYAGMTLLIRQLGYSLKGAIIAGATYSLSSALVAWQGWPHSEVAMYAPFLFLLLDKALKRFKLGLFLWVAVLIVLMMDAGMPTFAAYFLYLAGAYVLFFGIRILRRRPRELLMYWGGFVISVVLGAVLSLPYTGGLLSTVGSNGYESSRSSYSLSALPLSQLKTLLFPYLPTSANMHFNESTLYTGILAMVTIAFTVIHIRHKPRIGFFAVTSVVLLLLIFTNVLTPIYSHLPMINTSLKYRVIVLLNFALSVMVGINIDDLLTRPLASVREKMAAWVSAAIAVAGFIAVLVRVFPTIESATSGTLQVWVACGVLIVFVIVILIRTFIWNKVVSIGCTCVLFVAVAVDMGYFASQYYPMIDKSAPVIPAPTSTIRFLQKGTTQQEKIVTTGSWDFFASQNMYYDLRDIRGHGFVFTNPDIKEYYLAIDNNAYDMSPTLPTFNSIDNVNLLKYLGVKYVVGTRYSDFADAVQQAGTLVHNGEDELMVYELDEYSPQVYLADTVEVLPDEQSVIDTMSESYESGTAYLSEESDVPSCADTSTELSPDENVTGIELQGNGDMRFTTTTSSKRLVVINEYNDGNWKAYVDGQETPVYKVNGIVRAVEVPAGTHTVELRYESDTLMMLMTIAAIGMLCVVVLAICARRINSAVQNFTTMTQICAG